MTCETKQYSQTMKSLRNRIMFRLDYYSLPRFKEKFLDIKGEISNNYRETNLTEEEKQMIDVDAVAYNLGESLDTILSKSVYYFRDVVFDDDANIIGDVVVGPYYLFLQLFLKEDGEITSRCYKRIKEFLFVKEMAPLTTTSCFTCQVDHQKSPKVEEIDSIIDIHAFTCIDNGNKTAITRFGKDSSIFSCIGTDDILLANSRYTDEYVKAFIDEKTVSISLSRMLQLAKGADGLFYYNVLVNTNLCVELNDDFSNMNEEIIDKIIEYSTIESSRCFK